MFGKFCLEKMSLFSTDRSDQSGTHWWGILNISPKSELFFYSYGIEGMKHFNVSDDQKIIRKKLKGIEIIDQKAKKVTLCKLKCLRNAYDKLNENEHKKPLESAQDFFHLIHSFGKNEHLTNFVNIWILEDPVQMSNTVSYCIFKYLFKFIFTKTFFFPYENSKTHSYKKLTNNAIVTLLNELFTLHQEINEQLMNEYIRQKQIDMT